MSGMISYTHWAYFPDEASARRCAGDLPDYVNRIREPRQGTTQWLLLAGRDVPVDGTAEQHREVEAIVTRHGGRYDGGESTWQPVRVLDRLIPVADPVLTDSRHWSE
ncbi:hypothetical protein [Streptomyces wuyuanensis]|uniref:hypothetical protein n=1 Tax=Streptomyces wuyuanensis TaxID=1196353 RepID=UPI003447F2AF